jgi:pilus assembly protein CpaF
VNDRLQKRPADQGDQAATGKEPPAVMLERYAHWRERMAEFRGWMVDHIAVDLPEEALWHNGPKANRALRQRFDALCERVALDMPEPVRERLYADVKRDLMGLGPIQPLLDDPEVSEVMVNGPRRVFAERGGKLELTDVHFKDNEHVMRIARRIIGPLGRKVDRQEPKVDARLPDGSRVNIIIPPSAIDGPTITIRKFPAQPLTIGDLLRYGSLSDGAATFLRACVDARLNIIVSGGTGSGKTTLLNVLSSFIPHDERIVTIEDAAELQLMQPHVVRLETTPPLPDGTGRLTIRDLVINSLRMRPDRIVVGECRGGEALDMLQAMNTGHDGSLTTIHANNPRDCIARLETLVLMAGFDLPVVVVRRQIASAVDLIVQQARLRDGSRKVLQITELQGMEGDTVILQDIFLYKEQPLEGEGEPGHLAPTGIRPRFMSQLSDAGHELGTAVFGMPKMNFGR